MAHRPLHTAGCVLGVALSLTAALGLTGSSLRGTGGALAISRDATPALESRTALSESAPARVQPLVINTADGEHHTDDLNPPVLHASNPDAAQPAPWEVLADGPESRFSSARPVTMRGSRYSTAREQTAHRYEELPAPADAALPVPVMSAAASPAVTTDLPLSNLISELTLLRQDLRELLPANRLSPPSPAPPTLDLQPLHDLRADMRAISEQQRSLEEDLRQFAAAVATPPMPAGQAMTDTAPADVDTGEIQLEPATGEPALWSARMHNADPAAVLQQLGAAFHWNLVLGPEVQGRVTLSLERTTPDRLLSAVARALDCTVVEEGGVSLLIPRDRAAARRIAAERTVARLITPKHLSAVEILPLVQPLLTPDLGAAAISGPIGSDSSSGPSAHRPALLVVDFPEVLTHVEAMLQELDQPPPQFEIEAVITTVRHNERTRFGAMRELQNQGLCECTEIACDGESGGAALCGRTRCEAPQAVAWLERFADTQVEATPTLRVLNQQCAQLEVGSQVITRDDRGWTRWWPLHAAPDSPFPTSTSLAVRAALQPDGQVRLQVRPRITHRVTDPRTRTARQELTELTTDVTIPLGSTAVIGGLTRHDHAHDQHAAPRHGLLGRLRSRNGREVCEDHCTEVVIFLTPRLVQAETSAPELPPPPDAFGPSTPGLPQDYMPPALPLTHAAIDVGAAPISRLSYIPPAPAP